MGAGAGHGGWASDVPHAPGGLRPHGRAGGPSGGPSGGAPVEGVAVGEPMDQAARDHRSRRSGSGDSPAAAGVGAGTVVDLAGVSVVRDGRCLLDGIGWQIRTGDRWAVLGPNGSGKTTLLEVAAMQLLPTRGVVTVLGQRYGSCDARAVRQRIAFVSGALVRSVRPALAARDVVLTGRFGALEPWWHDYEKSDHDDVDRLLEEVGMADLAEQPFGLLSEGERQQVILARSLMGRPELILLDEPAAGLDLGARERLIAHLSRLSADRTAAPMVLVTHHVEEIPPGITHAMLVRQGHVVAAGPAEEVLASDAISECFETGLVVDRSAGRWRARAAG